MPATTPRVAACPPGVNTVTTPRSSSEKPSFETLVFGWSLWSLNLRIIAEGVLLLTTVRVMPVLLDARGDEAEAEEEKEEEEEEAATVDDEPAGPRERLVLFS